MVIYIKNNFFFFNLHPLITKINDDSIYLISAFFSFSIDLYIL